MTAHTCRVITPGCYRCDLNLDEIKWAEEEERAQAAREADCPQHNWKTRVTKYATWMICMRCGAEDES